MFAFGRIARVIEGTELLLAATGLVVGAAEEAELLLTARDCWSMPPRRPS